MMKSKTDVYLFTKEDVARITPNKDLENHQYPLEKPIYDGPTVQSTFRERKKSDILDLVGGDGPWQRRIFIIMLFAIIPSPMHNLSMAFLAPNQEYWCARPSEVGNMSVQQWKLYGLPPKIENNNRHMCSRYENSTLASIERDINVSDSSWNKTVSCDSWEYDNSIFTSTMLSEWTLVCDREWLVSLSSSLFMAGILVGVTLFGYLSDKLGRRPTIETSCFLMVAASLVCSFSTSFPMFIVARFFTAMGVGGYYTVIFVLLIEVSCPETRIFYAMAAMFGWCIGYVTLPGIAWLIRDWFWIQIAISSCSIPFLAIWWLIPESPRWLLSKGRVEDARKVLQQASEVNKFKVHNFDSALEKLMTESNELHESGETEGTVIDLLITPGLRKMTLNIYFLWFVNALVYYGISFNTNDLAGNEFINFLLFGAVEFPAYFISIFALKSYGRRLPLAATLTGAGIACLLAYALPEGWSTTLVSMVGKFCITASFGILYIYTTELFPTLMRNAGLGSAAFCECIASMLAPFAHELGMVTDPVVPLAVEGALAFVAGLMVLLLPETHNCVIPNTLKEATEASKSRTGFGFHWSSKTDAHLTVDYFKRTDGNPNTDLKETITTEDAEMDSSDTANLPSYKEYMLFQPSSPYRAVGVASPNSAEASV